MANMNSQIDALNAKGGNESRPKLRNTTSRVSNGLVGGGAKAAGKTTISKVAIPMGTTMHKPGTVPGYLKNS